MAETDDKIVMLEAKMATQMNDAEVLTKRDAAVRWCKNASDHAKSYGGKPWQYALIPHNVIAANMTLATLSVQFNQR